LRLRQLLISCQTDGRFFYVYWKSYGEGELGSKPLAQEHAMTTGAVKSSSSPPASLDGPYTVVAQNFSPGITAAVIKNAFQAIGGEISCCKIVATHPIITAEVAFVERAGAEKAIQIYNGTKVST
jgi:hypothetical protein